MPTPKTTKLPTDEQLLAAIHRAELHAGRAESGIPLMFIKEHLDLPRRGWSKRQLRPQLDRLRSSGLVEQSRRHSRDVWTLTSVGRRRLAAARRAGRAELPESPQHRVWREARAEAEARIEGFRSDVHERLNAAAGVLDAGSDATSDAWLATCQHVRFACLRLASATYCLGEWPEPRDNSADPSTPWKLGRLNPDRWDHP